MLWLLKPIKGWKPWYDKAFGFVVRAQTEQEARKFASSECGDEGPDVWLQPGVTTCVKLTDEGGTGVILRHYASA